MLSPVSVCLLIRLRTQKLLIKRLSNVMEWLDIIQGFNNQLDFE